MIVNNDTGHKADKFLSVQEGLEIQQAYKKMRSVSKKDTFEKSEDAAVLPSENYLDYSKFGSRSSVIGSSPRSLIYYNPIFEAYYKGEADMEDVESSMRADIQMLIDFESYSNPEGVVSDEWKEKIVGEVFSKYRVRLCSWGVKQCYFEGKALCGHREFAYYSSEIYQKYKDICDTLLSCANETGKDIVGKDCDYTNFVSSWALKYDFKDFWNNAFGTNMKQARITQNLDELPKDFTFFFEAKAYGRFAEEGKGEFGLLQIKFGKEAYKVDVPFGTAYPRSRQFSLLELLKQYGFAKGQGKYDFFSGIHLYHSPFYREEILKTADNISV